MNVGNPFDERPAFKKRLVNVSLTEAQFEDFHRMQQAAGFPSAGAFIKALLKQEHDRQETDA